eukprot:TRINITY_DN11974_c0_g1_i1.p1 TRINITY_DN11974_c0_g1~~TRINITY_DN11974_c0_g1_i1.p1  ORF type:complete len:254 (-),score=23.71 TRINITY_DN11974_c0_g1_i1:326-1087(-)
MITIATTAACLAILIFASSMELADSTNSLHSFSSNSSKAGVHWLWGTRVLAKEIPRAEISVINPALVAHVGKLASTATASSTEVRSGRNGAWQSRNKAFLDPKTHPEDYRSQVKRLRKQIFQGVREYLGEDSELFDVKIGASWANFNPTNAMNGPHTHPFSGLSGAYYVDCGGVPTCEISLMDPRAAAQMVHLPTEIRNTLGLGIDWTLGLWPGTLLIFPAWLGHWVPTSSAKNPRVSISFNVDLSLKKGKVR